MLLVRRTRTRQPQGFVAAADHPARPLVLLSFQQGITLPNAVVSSPATWTEVGTNNLVSGAGGLGYSNGSGGYQFGGSIQFGRPAGTDPAWFAVRFRHGAYANNGSSTNVIAGYTTSSFNAGIAVEIDSSNNLRARYPGGAASSTRQLTVGAEYTVVVAKSTSGSWGLWLDGALVTSGTGATTIFPADSTIQILKDSGTARYYQGTVYAVAYGASDIMGSAASLSGNFWQLFEPERVWVPVVAAGGAENLTIADASHGHTDDGLSLTSSSHLSVSDAAHAHSADNLGLSSASHLTVADATHGHTADNLTLDTSATLSVADATHAHAADALALTSASHLAVADATHAHSADNLDLTTGGANLVVQDATHSHSADVLALTSQSILVINDAMHAHTADGVALSIPSDDIGTPGGGGGMGKRKRRKSSPVHDTDAEDQEIIEIMTALASVEGLLWRL